MKKISLLTIMVLTVYQSFAQMPDKLLKAIEGKMVSVDTTSSVDGLIDLANSFERMAEAEKSQWLPFYYAAYCKVTAGLMMNSGGDIMSGNAAKTDPIADQADNLLSKAEALSKDNSEIFILKKMIATLRLMGDPMNRFMTYGPLGEEALQTAIKLNPENPRIYLLQGQDKFFTPEQFGGSKSEAKTLFETAIKKFGTFRPETSIHPAWGLPATRYFYSQIQ